MIAGFVVLLVCQLIGEFIVRVLAIPVPGPVIGMVVLFVALQLRRPGSGRRDLAAAGQEPSPFWSTPSRTGVVRAADALLRNLQLLFIPAGVGVIQYLSVLADAWLPVTAGLVLSWLAVLLVTSAAGVGTLRIARWFGRGPGSSPGAESV